MTLRSTSVLVSASSELTKAFACSRSQVKTTQPTRYLVQPNQGVLEPGTVKIIKIHMVRSHSALYTVCAFRCCQRTRNIIIRSPLLLTPQFRVVAAIGAVQCLCYRKYEHATQASARCCVINAHV
jgi:MSP (Major sperm protein) domain